MQNLACHVKTNYKALCFLFFSDLVKKTLTLIGHKAENNMHVAEIVRKLTIINIIVLLLITSKLTKFAQLKWQSLHRTLDNTKGENICCFPRSVVAGPKGATVFE